MLDAALRHMGHDVTQVADGNDAWNLLQQDKFRMVIADWMMPGMDGLELVRNIRSLEKHGYIYTMLLTSRGQTEDIIHGLAAGADDYITKPFEREELRFRIRAGERVIKLEKQLAARNEQLRRLALIDELTGIGNRRAFDEALGRLFEQCRRFRHPLAVAMIDIDYFKRYNDAFGHRAGDDALQQVAKLIGQNIRTVDLSFRYGGEEFAYLLPETDIRGSAVVAERLRRTVENAKIPHPDNPPHDVITISAGVASYDPRMATDADAIVQLADQALYRAKAAGRNKVEVSTMVPDEAGQPV